MATTLAFGVEPSTAPYRLRLARYQALGESVAEFARTEFAKHRRPLQLLDVGTGVGRARRYIEAQLGLATIAFHGVDRFAYISKPIYKHHDWTMFDACLEEGLPFLEDNRFDIVICEQVLEHLHNASFTAKELVRVLRNDGLLIVGVPIFPPGVASIRKHIIPTCDELIKRWWGVGKDRSHVQAWSLSTFRKLLLESGVTEIWEERGFRILSGGPLRPLEHTRWWWQFNRCLGKAVPGLCIEAQVVCTKTSSEAVAVEPLRRAA